MDNIIIKEAVPEDALARIEYSKIICHLEQKAFQSLSMEKQNTFVRF